MKEKNAHVSQTDLKKGFGGKFGVQTDRVDASAVGFDYHEKLAAHASQKDHSTGFGGKFGVQKDRVDKSAVGWEHHEKVDKHESQKGKILHFSYLLYHHFLQIIHLVLAENSAYKRTELTSQQLVGNIMKRWKSTLLSWTVAKVLVANSVSRIERTSLL